MERLTTDSEQAYKELCDETAPFVPSRAQIETKFLPIVRKMWNMPEPDRRAYVSGARAGTMAAVAIRMMQGS